MFYHATCPPYLRKSTGADQDHRAVIGTSASVNRWSADVIASLNLQKELDRVKSLPKDVLDAEAQHHRTIGTELVKRLADSGKPSDVYDRVRCTIAECITVLFLTALLTVPNREEFAGFGRPVPNIGYSDSQRRPLQSALHQSATEVYVQ